MNKNLHTVVRRILPVLLLIPVIILHLCLFENRLQGAPFIKIDRVDYGTNFPNIDLYLIFHRTGITSLEDINEESLYVYEDGYRVNYINIMEADDNSRPRHIVLSIDSSKSIKEKGLEKIKKIAQDILTAADSSDQIALYRFNDTVELLNSFTTNRKELMEGIQSIHRRGSKTHLLNSIYDSIDMLGSIENVGRAVIVFTDGIDEGSSIKADDVIHFAQDNSIPVFFVCTGTLKKSAMLGRIAKLTGGRVILGSKDKTEGKIYRMIGELLPEKYILKYRTIMKPDGRNHTLEVRLKHGTIRDREVKEIKIKPRLAMLTGPYLIKTLFALVLFLLLVVVIFVLMRFKKAKERITKDKTSSGEMERAVSEDFSKALIHDEKEKVRKEKLITQHDPEYVYSRAWLVQKLGPQSGKKFPIFWEVVTLGKDEENSIVIKDDAVSLSHAKIKEMKGAYYIFDLASDNGTFLNDQKLLRPKPLYDWDEIKLGRTVFIFRGSKIK